MKNRISTVLCVVAAVVFVVGAVGIGAYRGWQGEREKALTSLSGNSVLAAQLSTRSMDAANLAVVAARHLPADDAQLTALKQSRTTLEDADATADELARADAVLAQTAEALGTSLPALASVKDSPRDQVYISTLTRTLSERTDVAGEYEALVADFNDRLTHSLTGRLAMLLGIDPLTVA